ncbi:MAG: CfrBI family restriction endonuclease [Allobaculum sp.]|nr:CfrBI family restriction endonuclease [Allobaculum sp.]
MKLKDCIPDLGKNLVNYGKADVIDRLGKSVIQKTVIGILKGENIRTLTESLTKRRVSLSAAAMLKTYLTAFSNIPDFSKNYVDIIFNSLTKDKPTKSEKTFLTWMAGLTEKQIQNVLRGKNKDNLKSYLTETMQTLSSTEDEAKKEFGELLANIKLGNTKCEIAWLEIIQLFLAIGSQTLAIRGSEKSTYGKMFEKLVLGSVLSLLGFDFVQRNDVSKSKKIFWLSERDFKRESDATALLDIGKGIRFDIGFIGVGNTEISLDKVTRFENTMSYNNKHYNMSTIIIVGRIGEKSRIVKMAQSLNKGHIVQMSMSNWVKELSCILYNDFRFKTPIYGKTDREVFDYLEKNIKNLNMQDFLSNKTVRAER